MATSFGLGDEPVIIGEDIVTQEDVQKAVKAAKARAVALGA